MRQPSYKNAADRDDCCGQECESGMRNRYFEDKRLSIDSFRVEQNYLIERRRLLNRAIHGWGVVYGYKLSPANDGRLTITSGLALDTCGRELLQTCDVTLSLPDVHILKSEVEKGSEGGPTCWLLRAHYAEEKTSHVEVRDSCHREHDEWNYACEQVCYSLQEMKCSECFKEAKRLLRCGCADNPLQDETDERQPASAEHPPVRGGLRCLCKHLEDFEPGCECRCLQKLHLECDRVRVDWTNGVPLACIAWNHDASGRWAILDACGPRPLVKGNDLLYDLIRGCDLTRIINFGWEEWHRSDFPMPFSTFLDALHRASEPLEDPIKDAFWVRFSRPVRAETVRPECFALTIMTPGSKGGWWMVRRAPITDVDFSCFPRQHGDPPNTVRGAAIIVTTEHCDDGVKRLGTQILENGARVEIEVRGDYILDCNGQTIDANAIGRNPVPGGNGSPGGTFLSTFIVAKRDAKRRSPLASSGDYQ